MKHIKLLGILTILIIITEFVLSIPSGMESFQEGMEAGMQEATACKNNAQTPLPHPIKVTVQVSPVNAPLQTVTLNCGQNRTTQAVYATDSITCNISEPASHAILTIISIITLFPVLYGVYSLIRLLICVSQKRFSPEETAGGFVGSLTVQHSFPCSLLFLNGYWKEQPSNKYSCPGMKLPESTKLMSNGPAFLS